MKIELDEKELWEAKEELTIRKTYSTKLDLKNKIRYEYKS